MKCPNCTYSTPKPLVTCPRCDQPLEVEQEEKTAKKGKSKDE